MVRDRFRQITLRRVLVTLTVPLVLIAIWEALPTIVGSHCDTATVDEVLSPDLRWRAVTDHTLCESPFLTYVLVGLRIADAAVPERSALILAVQTGDDADRPWPVWIASDVLQVTVRSLDYVKVLRQEFAGIQIIVRAKSRGGAGPGDQRERAVP